MDGLQSTEYLKKPGWLEADNGLCARQRVRLPGQAMSNSTVECLSKVGPTINLTRSTEQGIKGRIP